MDAVRSEMILEGEKYLRHMPQEHKDTEGEHCNVHQRLANTSVLLGKNRGGSDSEDQLWSDDAGVQTLQAQKKLGWYPGNRYPEDKHGPHDERREWAGVIVTWDLVLMWEQTHRMNHIYFGPCTDNLH